jgi:uncharacterized OB-fold protein
MRDYRKFLPESIPASHLTFWESLKEHAVKVQRCESCATFRYIPKDICPTCNSAQASWEAISGLGEVYTYTIVRRAPTPAYQEDAPYVIAHVTMDEGFRMAAKLITADLDSVHIGMPVRIAYEDVTPEWTLFIFQPAG